MDRQTVSVGERTYQWADPASFTEAALGRDGLEFMRAMGTGELPPPPLVQTMGMRLAEVERGRVVFEFQPAQFHYNAIGGVHGGVYAVMLDSATGCAVHTLLPVGVGYTSLDLTTKFLRPITTASGLLRSIGTVSHLGRRTALAQADLVDADGRRYGHATSSVLLLRP